MPPNQDRDLSQVVPELNIRVTRRAERRSYSYQAEVTGVVGGAVTGGGTRWVSYSTPALAVCLRNTGAAARSYVLGLTAFDDITERRVHSRFQERTAVLRPGESIDVQIAAHSRGKLDHTFLDHVKEFEGGALVATHPLDWQLTRMVWATTPVAEKAAARSARRRLGWGLLGIAALGALMWFGPGAMKSLRQDPIATASRAFDAMRRQAWRDAALPTAAYPASAIFIVAVQFKAAFWDAFDALVDREVGAYAGITDPAERQKAAFACGAVFEGEREQLAPGMRQKYEVADVNLSAVLHGGSVDPGLVTMLRQERNQFRHPKTVEACAKAFGLGL